ncbi:MAG: SH3 domain-containing protein [Lachnospiraceae bacterium]|nr:SH3 domain-containing protein [Lachnospiraceae bacterium]
MEENKQTKPSVDIEKIKELCGKVGTFVVKQKRYFGAGIVCIAMLLLLAFGAGTNANDKDPLAGAYQEYKQVDVKNEDEELLQLVSNYYEAYASNDLTTLQSIAHPVSEAEQSYISFMSNYIESYNITDIFTKRGTNKDSYLVSVKVSIKFANVASEAPGLDFFYVETDEDGKLFINNLYSAYNQENGEQPMDSTISALISEFEQQQDVLSLQAQVKEQFNDLMVNDSELNAFVTSTLPNAAQQWAAEYNAQLEAAKAAAEQAKQEEEAAAAAKAEEEAAAAAKAEKEANATQVITTARINVRQDHEDGAAVLGKVDEGTVLKKYTEYGSWAEVEYNDGVGYVSLEYLENYSEDASEDSDDNTTTETADTSSNYQKGDEVILSSTVNVRSSMSETASKVAVAYAGEKVTVVMPYAEGWTKVTYKGKEGYIKSEYLK